MAGGSGNAVGVACGDRVKVGQGLVGSLRTMGRGEVAPFREHFKFENSIPHMVMFNKSGALAWDSRSQPLSDAGVDELVQTLLDAK